jgi:hypothetical protein
MEEPQSIASDGCGNVVVCGNGGDWIAAYGTAGHSIAPIYVLSGLGRFGYVSAFVAAGERYFGVSPVSCECYCLELEGTRRWEVMPTQHVVESHSIARLPDGLVLLGRDKRGEWVLEASGDRLEVGGLGNSEEPVGFLAHDRGRFAVLTEYIPNDEPIVEAALVFLSAEAGLARAEARVLLDPPEEGDVMSQER